MRFIYISVCVLFVLAYAFYLFERMRFIYISVCVLFVLAYAFYLFERMPFIHPQIPLGVCPCSRRILGLRRVCDLCSGAGFDRASTATFRFFPRCPLIAFTATTHSLLGIIGFVALHQLGVTIQFITTPR
jgi:hypothetical protein